MKIVRIGSMGFVLLLALVLFGNIAEHNEKYAWLRPIIGSDLLFYIFIILFLGLIFLAVKQELITKDTDIKATSADKK